MRYVVSEVRALVQFLGLAVGLGFRFRLSRELDVLGAELVHARFSVRVVWIAGGGVSTACVLPQLERDSSRLHDMESYPPACG